LYRELWGARSKHSGGCFRIKLGSRKPTCYRIAALKERTGGGSRGSLRDRIIGGNQSGALTVPAFAGEPKWIEVKSPQFSVVKDSGAKRGREVAIRFEQMRAVFGALLMNPNSNLPVPLQIVAFRNTKELRQFAPLWHGKPTEVTGYFWVIMTAASFCSIFP
jgi:hypothetical protein